MTRAVLRRATAWLAAAGTLVGAIAAAHADTPPNAWQVAADPPARDRWHLHRRVERLRFPPRNVDGEPPSPGVLELNLESARALLEQADAARSPDVRLRIDLGLVDYDLAERRADDDLYGKAAALLAPAVAAAADAPAATEALAALTIVYAKLNQPELELDAWHRYLPRLTDDRERATAMMNMGEAEMRLGRVDDAVATFREVLRLCGELPNTVGVSQAYVLTLWDVAVALDRAGDPGGALEAAGRARRMGVIGQGGRSITGSMLIASGPNVFFVPAWEREWYLALDAMAAAHDAHDPRDAAPLLAAAEGHWTTYVDRSSATKSADAFLPIARVRQADARARRAAAEKAAAKLPRRPSQPTSAEIEF